MCAKSTKTTIYGKIFWNCTWKIIVTTYCETIDKWPRTHVLVRSILSMKISFYFLNLVYWTKDVENGRGNWIIVLLNDWNLFFTGSSFWRVALHVYFWRVWGHVGPCNLICHRMADLQCSYNLQVNFKWKMTMRSIEKATIWCTQR